MKPLSSSSARGGASSSPSILGAPSSTFKTYKRHLEGLCSAQAGTAKRDTASLLEDERELTRIEQEASSAYSALTKLEEQTQDATTEAQELLLSDRRLVRISEVPMTLNIELLGLTEGDLLALWQEVKLQSAAADHPGRGGGGGG